MSFVLWGWSEPPLAPNELGNTWHQIGLIPTSTFDSFWVILELIPEYQTFLAFIGGKGQI